MCLVNINRKLIYLNRYIKLLCKCNTVENWSRYAQSHKCSPGHPSCVHGSALPGYILDSSMAQYIVHALATAQTGLSRTAAMRTGLKACLCQLEDVLLPIDDLEATARQPHANVT